jgi:hypothetical protein
MVRLTAAIRLAIAALVFVDEDTSQVAAIVLESLGQHRIA